MKATCCRVEGSQRFAQMRFEAGIVGSGDAKFVDDPVMRERQRPVAEQLPGDGIGRRRAGLLARRDHSGPGLAEPDECLRDLSDNQLGDIRGLECRQCGESGTVPDMVEEIEDVSC